MPIERITLVRFRTSDGMFYDDEVDAPESVAAMNAPDEDPDEDLDRHDDMPLF